MKAHLVADVRDALQAPPWIEPTRRRSNSSTQLTIQLKSILWIANSLRKMRLLPWPIRWLGGCPHHQDQTVAVLAPRNQRGFELADELRRRGID